MFQLLIKIIKVLKEPEMTNYFASVPQNQTMFDLFKSNRPTYLKIAESSMSGHVSKNRDHQLPGEDSDLEISL
jgi:hypothetical protein